jgi:CheY-like chemotaxis protein
MGLKGSLDELSILDVLQIVGFSKKTGSLHVSGSFGQGVVVFKNGLVYSAFSPSTGEFLNQNDPGDRPEEREALLIEQVQMALRELTVLREGNFEFVLTQDLPEKLNGIDLASFYLRKGIDTQGLLLGLVKEIDDERREATELLESYFKQEPTREEPPFDTPPPQQEPKKDAGPVPADEIPAVVLVDDEPLINRIVGVEFQTNGYKVQTATSPDEALSAVRALIEAGRQVLVVTDLRMPTTTGTSFFGGFELIRLLKRNRLKVPILLMTEKLPPKVRARAKKLGIRRVAFKPALSKLDPKQYGEDLRSFAAVLTKQLADLATAYAGPGDPSGLPRGSDGRSTYMLDLLTSMTAHLMRTRDSGEVTRMVLHVASRCLDRGILFLLKQNKARGLGGFGLSETKKANFEIAQKLSLDLHELEPFSEVVHRRKSCRFTGSSTSLEENLYEAIGRGNTQECILMPMLNHNEVIAILYGDNFETGRPLGKLRGLELFFAQAGMALENLSLHRKLRFFESKLSREGRETKQGQSHV